MIQVGYYLGVNSSLVTQLKTNLYNDFLWKLDTTKY